MAAGRESVRIHFLLLLHTFGLHKYASQLREKVFPKILHSFQWQKYSRLNRIKYHFKTNKWFEIINIHMKTIINIIYGNTLDKLIKMLNVLKHIENYQKESTTL